MAITTHKGEVQQIRRAVFLVCCWNDFPGAAGWPFVSYGMGTGQAVPGSDPAGCFLLLPEHTCRAYSVSQA